MFEIGDKVKVALPTFRDSGISTGMRKYNSKVTKVTGKSAYPKFHGTAYTLDGFVSPFGINYEFMGEWLVAVESEVSNESASESA